MITATLTQLLGTQTPERGTLWEAVCQWNGKPFAAQSRSGASYELCRVFVDAGCPDDILEMRDANGRLMLTIHSIAKAADHTIAESPTSPIHLAKFKEWPAAL